jgi:hypothetical protein
MKKVFLTLLIAMSVWAVGYKAGDTVPPIDFPDQFGKRAIFNEMPQTLILTYEKGTSATVNDFLATQDGAYLQKHNAVYIADISGMPNFITEVFALPKMRKFAYPVLLIRDEEQGLKFPGEEGKVTVMKLKGNFVSSVTYVSTPEQLKVAIEQ